ncbi:MAG: helix-turn-helix domain-containing protein [Burkholderiales bacterium]
MLTHKQLVKRMLRKPAVRAEFKALEPEFALLDQLLKARARAGISQAEVARLEASLGSGRHSPSIATLRKYAAAVGKKLVIRLS